VTPIELFIWVALIAGLGLLLSAVLKRQRMISQRLSFLTETSAGTAGSSRPIEAKSLWTTETKIGLLAFVAAIGASLILNLPFWLSLLALLGLAPLVYYLVRRHRLEKKRKEFASYFPEAVDSFNRAIQAGLPVERALASVSEIYGGELGARFHRLVRLLELGTPFREALDFFSEKLNLPDVDFFCALLALNRESGSKLSPLLTSLHHTLREREAAARKLQGLTAESRGAARILATLPIFVIGIQAFLNPSLLSFLFKDPNGRLLLGYAIISIGAGILIINRMSRLLED
jgi:tight adherence protein B